MVWPLAPLASEASFSDSASILSNNQRSCWARVFLSSQTEKKADRFSKSRAYLPEWIEGYVTSNKSPRLGSHWNHPLPILLPPCHRVRTETKSSHVSRFKAHGAGGEGAGINVNKGDALSVCRGFWSAIWSFETALFFSHHQKNH